MSDPNSLAYDFDVWCSDPKKSTAALEAIIVQLHQLPAMLGAQTSKYIAAGIREVVQDDFCQPVEKAIEGPIRSIEVAAYHAREAVEQIKRETRFQNWTVFALILALGMALGDGGAYFFFARQVAALNDRFDHLEQLLLMPHLLQRTPTRRRSRPGRSLRSTKGRLWI
jgi:hypothetical protein